MISASGAMIGSRTRISRSSMRQNATTGAPVRSDPKLGKACAWRPSQEGGEREQLGRRDDALAAAAVDADLEHALNPRGRRPARHPWRSPGRGP